MLGGNDSDLVDLHFLLDPASQGSVAANVLTGGGNDRVTALFNSALIGLLFNADLGAGDDTFAGQFLPTALRGAAEQPIVLDPFLVQLREDAKASGRQTDNKRLTVVQDLAWALINSAGFLFNH